MQSANHGVFQDGIDDFTCSLCTVKSVSTPAEHLNRSIAFQHIDGELHAFASMELVASQGNSFKALLARTCFDDLESSLIELDIFQV